MIFTPMSVDDIHSLLEDVSSKVGFLTVKFPKSDKLFRYDGKVLSGNKVAVYLQGTGHLVKTSVKELLVQMTYETYQLHKLTDDTDYELALAVYERYFDAPLDSEEGRFAYLLSLIITDYEAEHYPMASLSTVDFIDTLLKERQLEWSDVRKALGDDSSVEISALISDIEHDHISINDLRALSHFFRLPVQAFIAGGYNA